MGELIRFPDRRAALRDQENIQVTITTAAGGEIMVECQGLIHIFGEVPGRCKCGENYWGDDILPEPPIGIHGA